MKLTTLLAPLALIFPAVTLATTVTVAYDQTYDVSGTSLDVVACSDGPNGLITRGFTTFGSLPSFPNISAAAAVAGWNSPNCGTCWQVTYNSRTVNVLAVDHAGSGFNFGLTAFNTLTNNQGVFLGRVNANAVQVAASVCGL